MKSAAIIEYGQDKEKVQSLHQAHREYLRRFLENGQLRAAGPFADDEGALWVLDAETVQAVDEIVQGDPYCYRRRCSYTLERSSSAVSGR